VGAVLLAVGYRVFMEWVDARERDAGAEQGGVGRQPTQQPSNGE
jgi:hypothetical protein